MKIKDIMTTHYDSIDSTCSMTEAAQMMKSLDIGVLPVKEGENLIGVLTDRDIVIRGLAEQRDPSSTQITDIFSSQVVRCSGEESVETAAKLMEEHQVRRLLVCGQGDSPCGIVSLGDIAVKTEQNELVGATLESISESAYT